MDKPSFSIYDASAGSGKTYSLVKEYLKIILVTPKDDAYKNILAITFTNKAVGEMKKRVVDCLYAFCQETVDDTTQDLLQQLETEIQTETGNSFPVAQIQAKSKRILKKIIHNYASFDISTIDKFTYRILRSFTFDLELPTLFEVSLDTDELLTEAVDQVIAKAGDDESLTDLLVDYALEKADDDKDWDVSRDIFEMSKLLVNENNRKEVVQYKDKSIKEFLTIKQKLIIASKKINEDCVALAKDSLGLITENGIEITSFNRKLIPNVLQKIADGAVIKYDKLHYLDEGNRYAKSKPQGQKDAIDGIAGQLLANMQQINEQAETYFLYEAFLKNIIPLSLLNTISNSLDSIQKEKNVLSISEFNAIINKEIQNQPAPFIYERLGERYNHFFIDEFQDTSEMQWQNLIPLIDNALAGETNGIPGTLMLVGDPKQSIYRWRGGKAEQFIALAKDENPFSIQEKERVSLDTNYRSYSEVIEFNNQFFKTISDHFDNQDYQELYANQSVQKTNSKKGGFVSIDFLESIAPKDVQDDEPDQMQLYLDATLDKVQQAVANGFSYADIAILTRANKNSVAVANHLTENEIPILSSDSLLLYWSNEIRLLLDILRYIENSNDKISKASLLRYIAENSTSELEVHDFIKQGIDKANDRELELWLAEFDIQISFNDLRQKSIYQGVEICVEKLIPKEKYHAYVQYFLDIVLEFDIRKQASLSDFFEFWSRKEDKFKIPSPEGNNAVQIMSIHKSKGLEFPVVIFPFVDESIFSTRNSMWVESQDESIGLSNVLIGKSKKVVDFGAEAASVFDVKQQEELLDTINVLYVAFTRAEEQLHIISSLKVTKDVFSKTYTSYFLGSFLENQSLYNKETTHYEWGNPERVSTPKNTIKSENTIIQAVDERFDQSKIRIAKREALLWDTKQAEAIEYGNILHEIMAKVNQATDVDNAVEGAVLNGIISQEQKDVVAQTCHEIISQSELQDYFSSDNTAYNERSILVKNGPTIKPDKIVFLDEKRVLILDYKTGSTESKHKEQINSYGYALEAMGYTVVQKVLVYVGSGVEVVVV